MSFSATGAALSRMAARYCAVFSLDPSATRAARSGTRSRTGTTWCTGTTGRTPWCSSTPPTTSPSSPASSAPRPASRPACSTSTSDPVTIEQIELAIVTRGFEEGWIDADPPESRTGTTVGVVGSGPAGLAVAAELNKLGHKVTVYERDEAPGGLLRFGVPDAKLEKWIIDRRVALLEAEGVEFACDTDVGGDVEAAEIRSRHDALVMAIGSRLHRDLDVPGRGLDGVHYAMDYLYQRNRWVAESQGRVSRPTPPESTITAAGKRVVVVGGGDTGMDCISNALREGAESVIILDVYPQLPPGGRPPTTPVAAAAEAHDHDLRAGRGRQAPLRTEVTELVGEDGRVAAVRGWEVEGTSSRDLKPIPGSDFEESAELVLIAIGFSHPEHEGAVTELGPRPRCPRQPEGSGLRDEGARRVRLRRRPGGAVAGGHRHRRGPALRPRRGPVPRGHRRGPPHTRPGHVRLRGRRPQLAASSGRDRPHRDGGRRLLVGPARQALALAAAG